MTGMPLASTKIEHDQSSEELTVRCKRYEIDIIVSMEVRT
jgi:hypothetical protein